MINGTQVQRCRVSQLRRLSVHFVLYALHFSVTTLFEVDVVRLYTCLTFHCFLNYFRFVPASILQPVTPIKEAPGTTFGNATFWASARPFPASCQTHSSLHLMSWTCIKQVTTWIWFGISSGSVTYLNIFSCHLNFWLNQNSLLRQISSWEYLILIYATQALTG